MGVYGFGRTIVLLVADMMRKTCSRERRRRDNSEKHRGGGGYGKCNVKVRRDLKKNGRDQLGK